MDSLGKNLSAGLTAGLQGLVLQGASEVVLGSSPLLGKLLAGTDLESLLIDIDGLGKELSAALAAGA